MAATISGDGTSTLINLTTSGNTVLGDASTDTLNVGNGGLVKDASGNVGIGTNSPTDKLHVSGTVDGTVAVRVSNGSTGASSVAEFALDGQGNNFAIRNYGDGTSSANRTDFISTAGSSYFTFSTASSERMRIDSSGNLLVNTTSAIGSARFVVEQNTTTANPMAVSNPRSTASTDYSVMFYRNGSIVGSVQTSLSATSYVTSSDYRLKENIAPMTGALDRVAQLKPCTYNWKLDGEASQGFIAHELAEVCPQAVVGEKDAVDAEGNPQYQGIDTSFLVATLTAAIQEQQAIITALQADVEALKAQGITNV